MYQLHKEIGRADYIKTLVFFWLFIVHILILITVITTKFYFHWSELIGISVFIFIYFGIFITSKHHKINKIEKIIMMHFIGPEKRQLFSKLYFYNFVGMNKKQLIKIALNFLVSQNKLKNDKDTNPENPFYFLPLPREEE